jgi:hypothetical protein
MELFDLFIIVITMAVTYIVTVSYPIIRDKFILLKARFVYKRVDDELLLKTIEHNMILEDRIDDLEQNITQLLKTEVENKLKEILND